MNNFYFSRIPSSVKTSRKQVYMVPNPWMMFFIGILVGYILPLVLKAIFAK